MTTREIRDLIGKYLEVKHGCSRYTNSFEIIRVPFNYAYEVNVFIGGSRQIVKNLIITDEQLEDFGAMPSIKHLSTETVTATRYVPFATESVEATVTKPYPFIQKEYTYGKVQQEKETTMNRLEAEAVLNNAAKALAKIELLEQKYGVDADYKNGDVLLVDIMYDNAEHTYTYAIVNKRGSFDDLIYWMENVHGTVVSIRKLGKGKAIIRNGVRV